MSGDESNTASQVVTCLTNTSAITLWSALAASAAYKCRSFDTPFGDSLSEEQVKLKEKSRCERMRFFGGAFALSAAVLGAAGARYLNWKA